MPRLDLVDDHLRRAQDPEPYVAFDAAWKAFNVLYEAEHAPGQPNRNSDLIGRSSILLLHASSKQHSSSATTSRHAKSMSTKRSGSFTRNAEAST